MAQTMTQSASEHSTSSVDIVGTLSSEDSKDIMATLDGMDRAWAVHDMIQFVSFMTPDVEWVNVVGMWWRGKAEVLHAHQVLHATMFKTMKTRTEAREISPIAPGVVLATTTSWHDTFTDPGGRIFPAGQDRLTQVLVKQADNRWLVRSGHNTPIDARAAAHDLAKMPLPAHQ